LNFPFQGKGKDLVALMDFEKSAKCASEEGSVLTSISRKLSHTQRIEAGDTG
jgi:hypothetical protein